jgi:uncharacterized protein (DUF1015 family)
MAAQSRTPPSGRASSQVSDHALAVGGRELYSGVVPLFEPFSGLRYSPSRISSLDDVVCPPYDVISDEERTRLLARSPANIVRLELPRSEDGEDPYKAAAVLLDAWRDGGILKRDREPAFYGYRMTYTDELGGRRATVGVIGALGLEEPGEGILPHEQTTPKARTDRLALLTATRANLSPIWCLSPTPGLTELLGSHAHPHPQEHTTCDDGVSHELWPIHDRHQVDDIAHAVGASPVLIADGHHRYETALAFQAEERKATGGRAGDHDLVMTLVVELAEDQLAVGAIHRLISGLPPDLDLVAALAPWFDLSATGPLDAGIGQRMAEAEALAVVTPAGVWLARPKAETAAAATHELDSSRLDVALAGLPAHQLEFQHGWDRVDGAVRLGHAQAAVLLRPARVEQIAAIARGGVRMPPKTTFFWPKPRTGMVVRELID